MIECKSLLVTRNAFKSLVSLELCEEILYSIKKSISDNVLILK